MYLSGVVGLNSNGYKTIFALIIIEISNNDKIWIYLPFMLTFCVFWKYRFMNIVILNKHNAYYVEII